MKLFKTVDEKFEEIGFKKVKEDKYGVEYKRKNADYNYTQCLYLGHKENGYHICQSYQKEVNKDGFNNVVGLTMYETKLVYKKMKQMGWRIKK